MRPSPARSLRGASLGISVLYHSPSLATAGPVTDVGGNIFTCRFDCPPKRRLSKQFGVPVTIRIFHNEFVVGDKQIRIDILHGRSQSIEFVGGIEVTLRFGPQTVALLAKLFGGGRKIVLQSLRHPSE